MMASCTLVRAQEGEVIHILLHSVSMETESQDQARYMDVECPR